MAKNAVHATVVPQHDCSKGAAIWTDLSIKHTEEIKVMQPKALLC
jgi:hypothetical protein